MAQQLITNGEDGLIARTALNSMFTELYGALVFPIKLGQLSANAEQQILANTYIQAVFINYISGAPVIRIGTTGGGNEVLDNTSITQFTPLVLQEYFSTTQNLFLTITGGTIAVTILISPNLF